MLSVSQKVVIDSIKKTTLLDKKATIAQGNISKQRDSLMVIVSEQDKLIDSLRKESAQFKLESDNLREANRILEQVNREKQFQIDTQIDKFDLKSKLYDEKIKSIRRKRFSIGPSVGYGLTANGQGFIAGLTFNYTIFRF